MEREDEDADDEYLCEPVGDGEEYDEVGQSYVVRRLMLSLEVEDDMQRNKLFRIISTINKSLFDLIIHSYSCENIIGR